MGPFVSLTDTLARFATRSVRRRGEEYLDAGRVHLESGDAWRAVAEVHGSATYDVEITRDPQGRLEAQCTCPYAAEQAMCCKHIWAVILGAEARSFLGGDGRPPQSLRIVPAPDDFDDLDELLLAEEPARRSPGHPGESASPEEWIAHFRERGLLVQGYGPPHAGRRTPPPPPTWRTLLPSPHTGARPATAAPGTRELLYVIDVARVGETTHLALEIAWRDRRRDGTWGAPRTRTWIGPDVHGGGTAADHAALRLLASLEPGASFRDVDDRLGYGSLQNPLSIESPLVPIVLPVLCATGRCVVRTAAGDIVFPALVWDDGPPWEAVFRIRPGATDGMLTLDFAVVRGGEELPRESVARLGPDFVLTTSMAARFDGGEAYRWIRNVHRAGAIDVPQDEAIPLIEHLLEGAGHAHLDVPADVGVLQHAGRPAPRMTVVATAGGATKSFDVAIAFDYGGVVVDALDRRPRLLAGTTMVTRDREAEAAAIAEALDAGVVFQHARGRSPHTWSIPARALVPAVHRLTARGWRVDAEGRVYRAATRTRASVRSGIDWFDLEGSVEFEDVSANLGDIIAALSRGETSVPLADGSIGVLPEEWLARGRSWAALAERVEGGLRFTRGQAALLDALLAAAPDVDVDAGFERARAEIARFEGIEPVDPPAGFAGELRPYQREGLGWMRFLERFGFGGCLADDMGLGKTVQVLAALADRRASGQAADPSLVVVPRSLVFNWLREAARFVPDLRVLDFTGSGRLRSLEELAQVDVVLTTYGTLRRDAPHLAQVAFDYVVLDEAHAIKNVDSQTAKAVRLLRGRNRLALTGTPVQNHLGELWSLFDFLNPGLLGRSRTFASLAESSAANPEARALLARAIRPYILRRTKGDVARDLPARLEDTIVCRLGADERRFYDALREEYRRSLGARIERDGWAKSQVFVLEALLRLRQAACHPGLVDRARRDVTSAKLDVLLSHLAEVREEGHKAIVFSQFVQLLTLVREVLDRDGVPYEYLDGRTRDRDVRVDRFQNDPACPLFLVSLKAGGLGLNLTAAEYVFLLDPWWNPAIEAQAIDRAHRIGQTRQVFAYRLIAEDTIEEKVLQLQAQKRALADGILAGDPSGLKGLTREDLDLLLS